MRYLIILAFFSFFASSVEAQSFSRATPATQQSITLDIDGSSQTLYVSSRGAHYIERTSSRTGNAYKVYFGYMTTHTFEGKNVFTNKDEDEYWVLRINRNGNLDKDVLTIN